LECIFVSFLFTFLLNCQLRFRNFAYTKNTHARGIVLPYIFAPAWIPTVSYWKPVLAPHSKTYASGRDGDVKDDEVI